MHLHAFSSLPLSCYRFSLCARAASELPAFLGSTLRGAFGHALKEAVCVMEHRDCERCLVAERCLYPYLFETPAPPGLALLRGQQQAPRPFVLSPPVDSERSLAASPAGAARTTSRCRHLAAGDELSFGLLLVGRAVEHLPYIVYALSNLARRGLGAARARFDLNEVAALDEHGAARVIYTGRAARIAPHGFAARSLGDFVGARLEQLPNRDTLGLRFMTPTRIRVEGDLQTGLSFALLVRNLLRRVSLLMAVHGRAPLEADFRALIERAATVETRAAQLRWWDWERYSNRQRTKMKLGGFAGEVEYAGDGLPEFMPLVAAGELLHVGAGTSFGLGRYRILS